jgi:hypothetical protein
MVMSHFAETRSRVTVEFMSANVSRAFALGGDRLGRIDEAERRMTGHELSAARPAMFEVL